MSVTHLGASAAVLVLALGLVDLAGGAHGVMTPASAATTAPAVTAAAPTPALAPAVVVPAGSSVQAGEGIIEPQTAAAQVIPISIAPSAIATPIAVSQLLPDMTPPIVAVPVQAPVDMSTVQTSTLDPAAAAAVPPTADALAALGTPAFAVTADDQYRVASASMLKDVTPFAAGSGGNTSNRMGEWLAADRSVSNINSTRAYAVIRLAAYGWGIEEWPALDRLWWHESGWAPTRQDGDTSRAWGIPQALPASKMAKWGDDYLTNPITQVNWGLDYIASRYGSPTRAWEFWKTQALNGDVGWY